MNSEPDMLRVLFRVCEVLEQLGVRFQLGGSLASSIHGFPRATLDADLVADLRPGQGRALSRLLEGEFYSDAAAAEEAIRGRRSFNLVHLQSLFKVDVFVLKDSLYEIESFRRGRPETLGAGGAVPVATPEDTVLHKLLWYRKGDEVSTRQWGDLVGVLKVQGNRVDLAYLRRWSAELGLQEFLDRALEEAGL